MLSPHSRSFDVGDGKTVMLATEALELALRHIELFAPSSVIKGIPFPVPVARGHSCQERDDRSEPLISAEATAVAGHRVVTSVLWITSFTNRKSRDGFDLCPAPGGSAATYVPARLGSTRTSGSPQLQWHPTTDVPALRTAYRRPATSPLWIQYLYL